MTTDSEKICEKLFGYRKNILEVNIYLHIIGTYTATLIVLFEKKKSSR